MVSVPLSALILLFTSVQHLIHTMADMTAVDAAEDNVAALEKRLAAIRAELAAPSPVPSPSDDNPGRPSPPLPDGADGTASRASPSPSVRRLRREQARLEGKLRAATQAAAVPPLGAIDSHSHLQQDAAWLATRKRHPRLPSAIVLLGTHPDDWDAVAAAVAAQDGDFGTDAASCGGSEGGKVEEGSAIQRRARGETETNEAEARRRELASGREADPATDREQGHYGTEQPHAVETHVPGGEPSAARRSPVLHVAGHEETADAVDLVALQRPPLYPQQDEHGGAQDRNPNQRNPKRPNPNRNPNRNPNPNATATTSPPAVPCELVAGYGLHPWRAHEAPVGWLGALAVRLVRDAVAVVGEAGLDHAIRNAPEMRQTERALQLRALRLQLALAVALARPVSLHSVRAGGVLLALARQAAGRERPKPTATTHDATATHDTAAAAAHDASDTTHGDHAEWGAAETEEVVTALVQSGAMERTDAASLAERAAAAAAAGSFPPSLALHSYTGSPDLLVQLLHLPHVGSRIYVGFSTAINLRPVAKVKQQQAKPARDTSGRGDGAAVLEGVTTNGSVTATPASGVKDSGATSAEQQSTAHTGATVTTGPSTSESSARCCGDGNAEESHTDTAGATPAFDPHGPRAEAVRAVLACVPKEHVLVESDRSSARDVDRELARTCAVLAAAWGTTPRKAAAQAADNTRRWLQGEPALVVAGSGCKKQPHT